MKRVAIIGGGSAGLCAARHFGRDPTLNFTARVFEKSQDVGGIWAYDRRAEFQKLSDAEKVNHPATMYKNLRTNLPKQVMVFPDFPFFPDSPTFQTHFQVQDYLKKYAEKFDLMSLVELGTEVIQVDPLAGKKAVPGFTKWVVTTRNVESKKEESDIYDGVLICNGHFDVPKLPDIKNLSKFKGHTIHSRTYKTPEPFKGLSVVVLGAGASGRDIAVDISSCAKDVILSHKRVPLPTKFPDLVTEKPSIQEISDDGEVVFTDGTTKNADALIFSTGYYYDLPFLTSNCRTKVRNATITPLYKHLFHIIFPSMAFVGLGREICPFPLFHCQAQCFHAILSGRKSLPHIEDMLSETFNEIRQQELQAGRTDQYHKFGARQWSYYDSLADLAEIERLPRYLEKMYDHVLFERNHDLLNYRKQNYELVGSDNFIQI